MKEHPDSPYIEESNFALGEFFFDHEKWHEALTRYEEVAKNKHASAGNSASLSISGLGANTKSRRSQSGASNLWNK